MFMKIQKIFNDFLDRRIYRDEGLNQQGLNLTWRGGYSTAMEAILKRQEQSESALQLNGETSLRDLSFYFRRFSELSEDIFLRDYDRGYFSSWRDYVEFLIHERLIGIIEEAEQRRLTNCVAIVGSQESLHILAFIYWYSKRIFDMNKTIKYKVVQDRFEREVTSRDVLIADFKLSSELDAKEISQITLAVKKTIEKNIFKLIILTMMPNLWHTLSKSNDMIDLISYRMQI